MAAPRNTPQTDDAATEAAMVKGQHNGFVNQMLQVAQSLADERDDVMKRIGANRDVLRNMATQGFLSDEQAAAIIEFYPIRERKTKKGDTPAEAPATAAAA